MVFGSVLAGSLQDRFGRRLTLALGSIFSAAGVGIVYASAFASTVEGRAGAFSAGKIIQGFTIGIVVATVQTYASYPLLIKLGAV
jgi:MFS family permease